MNFPLLLSQQLRKHLDDKGLLASDLARQAQVPKQCISDWLHGVTPRSIIHCKKVADALGITVDELLFGARPSVKKNALFSLPSDDETFQNAVFYQQLRRALQDSNDEGRLSYFMSEDNSIRVFTPSWSRVLGWSPEIIQRFAFSNFVHFEDQQRVIQVRRRTFETAQALTGIECRLVTSSGQVLHFQWSAAPGPLIATIYVVGENISCQFPSEADSRRLIPLKPVVEKSSAAVALRARLSRERFIDIEYDGEEPMAVTFPARLHVALTCLFELVYQSQFTRQTEPAPAFIVCGGSSPSLVTEVPTRGLRLLAPLFKAIDAQISFDEHESEMGAGWTWLRIVFPVVKLLFVCMPILEIAA